MGNELRNLFDGDFSETDGAGILRSQGNKNLEIECVYITYRIQQ